jgi:hypothetical protein
MCIRGIIPDQKGLNTVGYGHVVGAAIANPYHNNWGWNRGLVGAAIYNRPLVYSTPTIAPIAPIAPTLIPDQKGGLLPDQKGSGLIGAYGVVLESLLTKKVQ